VDQNQKLLETGKQLFGLIFAVVNAKTTKTANWK